MTWWRTKYEVVDLNADGISLVRKHTPGGVYVAEFWRKTSDYHCPAGWYYADTYNKAPWRVARALDREKRRRENEGHWKPLSLPVARLNAPR